MRKLSLWMQVSLDGYTEGPNGEFDWPIVKEELHRYLVDELSDMGAFRYGRIGAGRRQPVVPGGGRPGRHAARRGPDVRLGRRAPALPARVTARDSGVLVPEPPADGLSLIRFRRTPADAVRR
jgi:hypothetical protein